MELQLVLVLLIAAAFVYLIFFRKKDHVEAGVVTEQASVEVAPVTAPVVEAAPVVEEKPARKPRAVKAATPAKKPAVKKAAPAKKPAAAKKPASKKA
jgi:hypothetical protein